MELLWIQLVLLLGSLPVLAWQGASLARNARSRGVAPWGAPCDVWVVVVLMAFLSSIMMPFVVMGTIGMITSACAAGDGANWVKDNTTFALIATQGLTGCATIGVIFGMLAMLKPDFSFGVRTDWDKSWHPLWCFFAVQPVYMVAGLIEWLFKELGFGDVVEKQSIIISLQDCRGDLSVYLCAIFAIVVVAPIAEELFFRGLLFPFVKRFFGPWWAMLAVGVLFGALHQNLAAFLPLSLLGAYLCLSYERTDDIRVPIALHVLFNAKTLFLMWLFPEAV